MSKRITILPYTFVEPRNAAGEIERYMSSRKFPLRTRVFHLGVSNF